MQSPTNRQMSYASANNQQVQEKKLDLIKLISLHLLSEETALTHSALPADADSAAVLSFPSLQVIMGKPQVFVISHHCNHIL